MLLPSPVLGDMYLPNNAIAIRHAYLPRHVLRGVNWKLGTWCQALRLGSVPLVKPCDEGLCGMGKGVSGNALCGVGGYNPSPLCDWSGEGSQCTM